MAKNGYGYHPNKTERDTEYVSAYLHFGTLTEASKECGVSCPTIARALDRSGIKRNGRKEAHETQKKISDEQLTQEAKAGLSCAEVAKKYSMSFERVYKRAKAIGHWYRRLKLYGNAEFDKSITLKAVTERDKGVCQICGQPVDAAAIKNGHILKMYPTVDHIVPLSKGGAHVWENVRLAHMACNAGKCDKTDYAKEA